MFESLFVFNGNVLFVATRLATERGFFGLVSATNCAASSGANSAGAAANAFLVKVSLILPIRVGHIPIAENAIYRTFVFVALAHFKEVGAFLTTMFGGTTHRTATGMFAAATRSGASRPKAEGTHKAINRTFFLATFSGFRQMSTLLATVAGMNIDGTVANLGA